MLLFWADYVHTGQLKCGLLLLFRSFVLVMDDMLIIYFHDFNWARSFMYCPCIIISSTLIVLTALNYVYREDVVVIYTLLYSGTGCRILSIC